MRGARYLRIAGLVSRTRLDALLLLLFLAVAAAAGVHALREGRSAPDAGYAEVLVRAGDEARTVASFDARGWACTGRTSVSLSGGLRDPGRTRPRDGEGAYAILDPSSAADEAGGVVLARPGRDGEGAVLLVFQRRR